MISLASAITIYSGSSYTFESEEFEYWEVVGNSSDMEGMNVTWEDGNITITFDPLFAADTFTLIFFNNYTEIINIYNYDNDCEDCEDCENSCSSGTKIIYKDRNITVPYVTDDTNTKNITMGVSDTQPEDKKTIPWWLWTSIVLLIGIIIVAFVLSKNKPEVIPEEWKE